MYLIGIYAVLSILAIRRWPALWSEKTWQGSGDTHDHPQDAPRPSFVPTTKAVGTERTLCLIVCNGGTERDGTVFKMRHSIKDYEHIY